VGQLTAEKGHAVLVRAWAEVVRQRPAARLVLVGDGPERARIEELARSLEVPGDSMVLTGFRDDVPSWLAGFDLYVQPSLEEGLGTSVLDAMACRLPVVASRAGGLPEAVVDGETGVLVPRADAPALAQAMLELLAAPERCAFMGEAGRRRVEARFSVEAMVAGYLEVYQGLTVSDQGSA